MSRLVSLLKEKCPNCSHTFEIEPGYFYGAMFVSYALVVMEMFLFFLLSLPFDITLNIRLTIIIVPMLFLSIVNFRFSRIIWMYLFTNKKSK